MSLSTNLRDVANKLLDKYGNNGELYKEIISNPIYDPNLGKMVGNKEEIVITTKYSESISSLRYLNIDERQKYQAILIIPYKEEIKDLNNSWKFKAHGQTAYNQILQVQKTTAQDNQIIFKLYFGYDYGNSFYNKQP